MAQGRMIKRDFWTSQEFYKRPFWVQVLVGAMITHADDWGTIAACPDYLRTRFLSRVDRRMSPKRQEVVRQLSELCQANVLQLSEKDGVSYYKFTTFDDHQKLRGRGKEGKGIEGKERKGSGSDSAPLPDDCPTFASPLTDDRPTTDVVSSGGDDFPPEPVYGRLIREFGFGPPGAQAICDERTHDALDGWLDWGNRFSKPIRLVAHCLKKYPTVADMERFEGATYDPREKNKTTAERRREKSQAENQELVTALFGDTGNGEPTDRGTVETSSGLGQERQPSRMVTNGGNAGVVVLGGPVEGRANAK